MSSEQQQQASSQREMADAEKTVPQAAQVLRLRLPELGVKAEAAPEKPPAAFERGGGRTPMRAVVRNPSGKLHRQSPCDEPAGTNPP